ncbi:NAD(P)-dependent dehydrogenase, short-chain alcohol dehydrogenase family [Catalinimonas alkaloidigena]|uniref:NAD(P)-dependent dehydrogenase, short-chain alcohol dehydrogenase family n=1 Tax=Catalinimonas alkaloidigena TaxID=1075417 RepID=A0A1G9J7W0_9BACT|nr:SDR family oxidoreductase [Catalinimonas alkaloidigena]SDL33620.1 NAD(P)-dependent dehydrogenase, short-chain alcohol dehydrogenase family [Catalinimonas alkaloidigena]
MFQLTDKIALITGAASGIGQSIALRFAAQGALVIVADRDQANIDTTLQLIQQQGGKAHPLLLDVTDHAAVKTAFESVVATFGRLDILVNNAGVAHVGNLENTSEADFDRVYAVNVKGAYNCLQAAIRPMKAQGGGIILNMASVAATAGIPDRFAYSMSKGAVLNMTLSVARDYVQDGIRCNAISPARIHTPFVDGFLKKYYEGREEEMFEKLSGTQPIGRMGKPDEVANLALYLCSDEAAFITGSNFPIDGGFLSLNMNN